MDERKPRRPREPSMANVAHVAGVSHQTVSRVLNGSASVRADTRDRVLAAIGELGYRRNTAARELATNRSGRLGVIAAHLGLYGPSMIANAVQEAGYDGGYHVSLVGLPEITRDTLRAAADRLLDQSSEGIIVAIAHREGLALAESLKPGIPVVVVEGVVSDGPWTAGVDQELGARLATRHLLELGHESVAFVGGPPEWIESVARRDGWKAEHVEAGRQTGPELVGNWSAASGYEAGKALSESGATAVFVANDHMALGVLCALREVGLRVPEDISVVGFDDLPEAAYFSPPLTTVRQDFAELGRRAIDVIVRALDGDPRPSSELVNPTLVVRASTRSPAT
jgi:DNA-binding LacI/PurR family transcriptional regulator